MAIDPKKNIGKKLVAFPYDKNSKPSSVLLLPIVQGNEVIGYLPAKATDNGDGTATLNTSGAGGGGVDPVGLKNIANVTINPSTEGTLLLVKTGVDGVNTKLVTLNAKDFATQATLAAINTQLNKLTFVAGELKVTGGGSEASSSGVVEHHNGTANIAVATVTFSATIKHVQIENFDASADIFVSFNGGTLFKTIQTGTVLDVDGIMADLKIKASADGTSYEILAIV